MIPISKVTVKCQWWSSFITFLQLKSGIQSASLMLGFKNCTCLIQYLLQAKASTQSHSLHIGSFTSLASAVQQYTSPKPPNYSHFIFLHPNISPNPPPSDSTHTTTHILPVSSFLHPYTSPNPPLPPALTQPFTLYQCLLSPALTQPLTFYQCRPSCTHTPHQTLLVL